MFLYGCVMCVSFYLEWRLTTIIWVSRLHRFLPIILYFRQLKVERLLPSHPQSFKDLKKSQMKPV